MSTVTPPNTYTITPGTTLVSEGTSTVTFTITRTPPVGFSLSAESMYASTVQTEGFTNSGDYSNVTQSYIGFSAGQASTTVSINIINDGAIEPNEAFALIVQSSFYDPPGVYLAKAIFIILDNDGPPQPTDTTTPVIFDYSPANGDTAVAVNSNIIVTFTENIALGNSGLILLKDGSGNVVETFNVRTSPGLSVKGNVLTIDPASPLATKTDFTLEIGAGTVMDLAGNAFAGNGLYHITTADNPGVTLTGSDANDTLTGTAGDDILNGGGGNDSLSGGAGNDVLDGGTGADSMAGGDGADTYYVDNAGDLVVETASNAAQQIETGPHSADVGRAVDKVIASINYTLTAFVENLTLSNAAGNLSGTGNDLNNVLLGNEHNNVFKGGAGNDSMDGGAGTDMAVYSGKLADYIITLGHDTDDNTTITDKRGIAFNDATDTIVNIDRLQFADANLAIDLGADQAGGKAALTMGALLGPAFTQDKTWAGIFMKYFDSGATLLDGANLLIASGILPAFAGGADNTALVKFVYANIVGSAPDAAALAAQLAPLDNHSLTQAQWFAAVAATAQNQAHVNLTGLALGWQYILSV